jgi:DNA-binding FadR family transcriptional regulator
LKWFIKKKVTSESIFQSPRPAPGFDRKAGYGSKHKNEKEQSMQKHEIVIKKLVADIFNNRLRGGQKLPTERDLSAELGVDRTSLRVALKQLQAMQVLDIRQGDGIYIKDYRKFAGVDFLRMFLDQEDNTDELSPAEYLSEEIWAFWIEFMPMMIRMAMERTTPMDLKEFLDIYDQELENLDNPEKIIELEVLAQEKVAEKTGNLIVLLISNSTRKMRRKMVQRFVEALDRKAVKAHVEFKRALLRGYTSGAFQDAGVISDEHKKLLKAHRDIIRQTWSISDEEQAIVSRVVSDEKQAT